MVGDYLVLINYRPQLLKFYFSLIEKLEWSFRLLWVCKKNGRNRGKFFHFLHLVLTDENKNWLKIKIGTIQGSFRIFAISRIFLHFLYVHIHISFFQTLLMILILVTSTNGIELTPHRIMAHRWQRGNKKIRLKVSLSMTFTFHSSHSRSHSYT